MTLATEKVASAQLVDGGQTDLHSHAGGGIESAFPVNCIFLSAVATNPNTLLGFGTWSQIAQGQFIVGQKNGDSNFGTVLGAGGAKTGTPTGSVAAITATATAAVKVGTSASNAAANTHTHPAPAFTGASMSLLNPYLVLYIWQRTA